MGTEEQRNFRSAYYEKVGCRTVEEKKTLERLLKEKPIELDNIREFARRFPVLGAYREAIWTLLLGISSSLCEPDSFVLQEQKTLRCNLERALKFLSLTDETTPRHKELTLMIMLERGRLGMNVEKQLLTADCFNILSIAEVFEKTSNPFVNDYWVLREFVAKVESLPISELVSKCHSWLLQENQQIFTHLTKTGAIDCLPYDIWFKRCFAGILDGNVVIRVWDKVIGGFLKVLPALAVLLVINQKQQILATSKLPEIRSILMKPLNVSASEVIFTDLIKLCDTSKLRYPLQGRNGSS